MKKIMVSMLCLLLLTSCSAKETSGHSELRSDNGEVLSVDVVMKDGQYVDVSFDETAIGKEQSKKQLKDAYGMKQASSIGKEWYEQAVFLEQYIVKNGVEEISLDEKGTALSEDVRSGCTMRIDRFLEAVKQAKQDAFQTEKKKG